MGESVVVAALPHIAEELDGRSQLGGPADQARDQDMEREEAADRDLRADDVVALWGAGGQLGRERVERRGDDGEQRAHRLKSRPEPRRVRMTTKSTAKAPGTITAGRSNGLRSSNSRTPPVGRTSTRGISC